MTKEREYAPSEQSCFLMTANCQARFLPVVNQPPQLVVAFARSGLSL